MPALCSSPFYGLLVLGFSYNSSAPLGMLVVSTEEAREDGHGKHVPKDLHVVCPHLLVSFLLGRPLWWTASCLAYGDHCKGGALAER
jgi:hypothetical protein